MPLIYKEENPELITGVWQITEPDDYFLSHIQLYPSERDEISFLKSRKKTEWIASRYLLHLLSGRKLRGACLKDEYGKPYLEGSSWHISMSHSADMVAVAACEHPVGVDVQVIVPKIYRIAPRFLNLQEMEFCTYESSVEYMHILWGAKECVFKAYGRKEVDFRNHINIDPFDYDPGGNRFFGSFHKNNAIQRFIFHSKIIKNFIFVYGYINQA